MRHIKNWKILSIKKIRLLPVIALLLTSCDDGDIIVTSFEFEEASMQLCRGTKENEFVFFKINTELAEAISLNAVTDQYSEIKVTEEPISIDLSDPNNTLIYRQFNRGIESSYYCSVIPDGAITVTNEYVSTEGDAFVEVTIIERNDNDGVDSITESGGIDPEGDPDEDGIPNYLDDDRNNPNIGDENMAIEEGFDEDGDGIPNYLDQDDDNDNIPTSAELSNGDPNDDSFRNDDGDDKPNYLDKDDDGDKIWTINEDIDGNGNPRDDDTDNDGIPNYLDDDDDGDDNPMDENDMKKTKEENPDPNGDGNPDDAIDSDMDGIPDYLDADNPAQDEKPVSLPVKPVLKNTIETTYRTTINVFGLEFDRNTDQFETDFFDFGFRDRKNSVTTDPMN